MQLSISAKPPTPERNPRIRLEGGKILPQEIILYNWDKMGVKDPPPVHKVRKFHKCICKLSLTLFEMKSFVVSTNKQFFNEDSD